MPQVTVNFDNVGSLGIINDLPAHSLPPEAWTDGANIRFHDNKVFRSLGRAQVLGTPSIAPYFLIGVPADGGYFILVAGQQKIYGVVASTETWTNITRQVAAADVNYSATEELLWNGGLLAGTPILNNGIDVPQYWPTLSVSTKMADLSNWPSTHRCRVIRPFKNFLIAMYITISGTAYPHRVLWSHPADPGTVPSSWDVTDATKDAGEFELTDAHAGVLLDGLTLGNQFILYKDLSAHRMSWEGGQYIFDIKPIPGQSGILHTDCVSVVPGRGRNPYGGMHFIATKDDLVLFDGNQQRSLLESKMRAYLNNSISDAFYSRSFTVSDPQNHEMLFYYPETGFTYPSRILAWNYDNDTIAVRETKDIVSARPVLLAAPSGVSEFWDDDSQIWDADMTSWDAITPYGERLGTLLGCDLPNTKIFQLQITNQFDGTDFTSFIERRGLAIVGRDRTGQPVADFTSRKMVPRVWPKASGDPFYVRVGAQDFIDELTMTTWGPSKLFRPGIDTYVDTGDINGNIPQGRFIAIRFESAANGIWQLHGYDLDVATIGKY